jgi:hypothetical protein
MVVPVLVWTNVDEKIRFLLHVDNIVMIDSMILIAFGWRLFLLIPHPPRQPLPHHFCRPRFQQAQTWRQRFMQLVMRRTGIAKNRLTNSWFKCWIWQTMLSLSFMLVIFEVRKDEDFRCRRTDYSDVAKMLRLSHAPAFIIQL